MSLSRDQLLRLAALRRAEAELYEEAAGAGEGDPRRPVRPPPGRRPPALILSSVKTDDLARKRARADLRRAGLRSIDGDQTDPRRR